MVILITFFFLFFWKSLLLFNFFYFKDSKNNIDHRRPLPLLPHLSSLSSSPSSPSLLSHPVAERHLSQPRIPTTAKVSRDSSIVNKSSRTSRQGTTTNSLSDILQQTGSRSGSSHQSVIDADTNLITVVSPYVASGTHGGLNVKVHDSEEDMSQEAILDETIERIPEDDNIYINNAAPNRLNEREFMETSLRSTGALEDDGSGYTQKKEHTINSHDCTTPIETKTSHGKPKVRDGTKWLIKNLHSGSMVQLPLDYCIPHVHPQVFKAETARRGKGGGGGGSDESNSNSSCNSSSRGARVHFNAKRSWGLGRPGHLRSELLSSEVIRVGENPPVTTTTTATTITKEITRKTTSASTKTKKFNRTIHLSLSPDTLKNLQKSLVRSTLEDKQNPNHLFNEKRQLCSPLNIAMKDWNEQRGVYSEIMPYHGSSNTVSPPRLVQSQQKKFSTSPSTTPHHWQVDARNQNASKATSSSHLPRLSPNLPCSFMPLQTGRVTGGGASGGNTGWDFRPLDRWTIASRLVPARRWKKEVEWVMGRVRVGVDIES